MTDTLRILIGATATIVMVGYAAWLEFRARNDEILPPPVPDQRDWQKRFEVEQNKPR